VWNVRDVHTTLPLLEIRSRVEAHCLSTLRRQRKKPVLCAARSIPEKKEAAERFATAFGRIGLSSLKMSAD
jgi:hypothetical protein